MRILALSLMTAVALGTGVAVAQAGSTLAAVHAGSPGAQSGVVIVAQAATPTPAPAPSPVSIIHIKNFAYVPDSVTIPAGSTVKFVEEDEVPHTVTASDGSFDSGNLNQKQTWTHLFAKPGAYAYYCAYHTYMKGKIIIVP
jgi:plastocyanin